MTTQDRHDRVLDAGLDGLSHALWTQRARLTRLGFKLRVAQLAMAGDDRTMVATAIDEAEDAVRELRAADHEPDRFLRAIFRHLGLGAEVPRTLRDLAVRVPEPWKGELEEHATAIASATTAMTATQRENRQLSFAGLTNVRSLIALVAPLREAESTTYDHRGKSVDDDQSRVDALL